MFFPCVGIAPVNKGVLLAAGAFAAERLRLPAGKTARPFVETSLERALDVQSMLQ